MTDYANHKIRDVLKIAKGNAKLAEPAIRNLAERDHKFLLDLVMPYLSGIMAHAIERNRKQISIPQEAPAPLPKKTAEKKAKPETGTSNIDPLLKKWAARFDHSANPAAPLPADSKVSQKHVDAIKALTSKNSRNKDF